MGTYQNYLDGKYKNNLTYPTKPVKPKILSLTASMLTSAEIASIIDVRDQYAAELEQYEQARREYNAEEGRLISVLCEDLEEEFDLADYPKRDAIWSLAWERGHSSGLGSVCQEYAELADLIIRKEEW